MRSKLATLLALLGAATITVSISCSVQVEVTPEGARYGWAGPEAVAAAQPSIADLPAFRVVGAAGDNARKNVRLWDFVKRVNGGKHLRNTPQQVGDCVSWGWTNAANYLACVQIANGEAHEFRAAYPPYVYGTSRVQIGGGRLGGDGSVGAWAARAVADYGILAANGDDVPPYSGSVARAWGARGPPAWALDRGKQRLVKTVAPIRTAAECRDAICNGYPVPICSDFGSTDIRERDGRRVANRNTSWAHCMLLCGYDGEPENGPYYYCLNSWGDRAHPPPLQDEPPGGFWIHQRDVERIVRQNDSFAISNFDGFPARDLDFRVVADRAAHPPAPEQEAPAIVKEEQPMQPLGTILGGGLLLCSAAVLLSGRRAAALAASLVCCLALGQCAPAFGGGVRSAESGEPELSFRAVECQPGQLCFRAVESPAAADLFRVVALSGVRSAESGEPETQTVACDNPACDCAHCDCNPCRCPQRSTRDARRVSQYDTSRSYEPGVWHTDPDGTRWCVSVPALVPCPLSLAPAKPQPVTVHRPVTIYSPSPAPAGYIRQCGPGGCRLIRR